MTKCLAFALLLSTTALACTTTVSGVHVQSVQTKMLPALPPNCPIRLVSVGPTEMAPNAEFGAHGKYEMVGSITVEAPEGTDPTSQEVRDQVRPEACKLGGAVVSLMVNATQAFQGRRSVVTTTQQTMAFTVWGPRSKAKTLVAF